MHFYIFDSLHCDVTKSELKEKILSFGQNTTPQCSTVVSLAISNPKDSDSGPGSCILILISKSTQHNLHLMFEFFCSMQICKKRHTCSLETASIKKVYCCGFFMLKVIAMERFSKKVCCEVILLYGEC